MVTLHQQIANAGCKLTAGNAACLFGAFAFLNHKMIVNIKISNTGQALALMSFLLFPFLGMAQVPGMMPKDSLKMDSMRKAIARIYSVRMDSIRKDAAGAALFRSGFRGIYSVADTTGTNRRQLLAQGVRFGHIHYLHLIWRAPSLSRVSADTTTALWVTFADGSTSILKATGAAAPHGSSMRHGGSELSLEFAMGPGDFFSLQNKTVNAITLNYTGGQALFNIGPAGAANLKSVCSSVAEKRASPSN